MFKIYTLKDKIHFSSEMIILFGLLDTLPNEPPHCYNFNNFSRYGDVVNWCKTHIEYVDDIKAADIVVLPFKFNGIHNPIFKLLNNLTKQLDKKLWCFYNDDDDISYVLDKHVVLFRTSFYKSSKKKNEQALIAFSADFYRQKQSDNISVGYCGYYTASNRRFPNGEWVGRSWYIDYFKKCKLSNDFIIRKGFWAKGMDKKQAQLEYFENMENNIFIFCMRGAGNFSYRFYETLMMGRIPIFIDTDCVLPFEESINLSEVGLFFKDEDIKAGKINLEKEILKYIENNKNRLTDIQKQNRILWEKFYSPVGFLNTLINTEKIE